MVFVLIIASVLFLIGGYTLGFYRGYSMPRPDETQEKEDRNLIRALTPKPEPETTYESFLRQFTEQFKDYDPPEGYYVSIEGDPQPGRNSKVKVFIEPINGESEKHKIAQYAAERYGIVVNNGDYEKEPAARMFSGPRDSKITNVTERCANKAKTNIEEYFTNRHAPGTPSCQVIS